MRRATRWTGALLALASLAAAPARAEPLAASPAASEPTGAVAPVASATSSPPVHPPQAPPAGPPPSAARTVGFVLAGLGVVGIGVGSYFAISAASEVGGASSDPLLCGSGSCTAAGRATYGSIRTQRTIAALGVGGGMIGLAGGAILLSFGGEGEPAPRAALAPIVSTDGAGLGFTLAL